MFRESVSRTADHTSKMWNNRWAGKPAATSINSSGYYQMTVLGSVQRAHRVIWKMVHGLDAECLDHINRDRLDNRIENLRSIKSADNALNLSLRTDNKSGVAGVVWNKRRNKWAARISAGGVFYGLGYHDRFVDAVNARKQAEKIHHAI